MKPHITISYDSVVGGRNPPKKFFNVFNKGVVFRRRGSEPPEKKLKSEL